MGIFSRMRDIISSNLNAMLEKAEDPEKLIRMMIQEMEDTLVEIKAQCANTMAQGKVLERQIQESRERADEWEAKSRLALAKDREDLAREALREKRRYTELAQTLEAQAVGSEALTAQYQTDISQVEEKIAAAREKQKILLQRHAHAEARKRAQQNIRRADSAGPFTRFEGFERRVDRMEAEADLVNYGRKGSLEEEFQKLAGDEELEKELEALRRQVKGEPV